jgi:putative SOS response-associated peptidase YedK
LARNRNLSEKLINQPVENLVEKPVLKKALLRNRCVLPADSFYVWKKVGKKTAVPYRVVSPLGLFSMAGLWEEFEDETTGMVHTFTLLTVGANQVLQPLHHRMPALLNREAEAAWLDRTRDSSELLEHITPMGAEDVSVYTVSPRILDPRIDVPSLIHPVPPADQHGNLTLFD